MKRCILDGRILLRAKTCREDVRVGQPAAETIEACDCDDCLAYLLDDLRYLAARVERRMAEIDTHRKESES